MEEFERLALLLDFYGALLTDRQRQIFEDHVCNDISLSEIAKEENISRQAVSDMIKRCRKTLEDYEEKLLLVQRFIIIKNKVKEIDNIAKKAELAEIVALAGEIIEEL